MLLNNITEAIGNTPLLKLNNINDKYNLSSNIYAKLEFLNPGSSIKDRPAYNMIKNANLKEGATIIEATSGNTGIGLAIACKKFGYKLIITMPESMSSERRAILGALGATLVLTRAELGMSGSISKAIQIEKETDNSLYIRQFENKNNSDSHYKTTAREIIKDLPLIDYFVSTIGSGGTITGCGNYLKEFNSSIKIISVEADVFPHGIQGTGAGFIPDILNENIIDDTIKVSTEQAYEHARILAKEEGLLCGISSGANFYGALKIAKQYKNKNIVIVLPDTAERYISAGIYKEQKK